MKIAVYSPGERELRCVKSFLTRRSAFLEHGVEFVTYPNQTADAVMTTSTSIEMIRNETKPTIVVDTADDGVIRSHALEAAHLPQVRVILKMALANPFIQMKRIERVHLSLPISEHARTGPPYTLPHWGKFDAAPQWFTYKVVQPLFEQLPEVDFSHKDRTIDIHFRGTVDYGTAQDDAPKITAHRRRLLDALQQLRASDPSLNIVIGEGRISRPKYYEELRNSRIVLSPWGWGETCIRTSEALLCGCTVLVPQTPYLITTDDSTTRFRECFGVQSMAYPVDPNYTDLGAAIQRISARDRESLRRERMYRILNWNTNFVGSYAAAFRTWINKT